MLDAHLEVRKYSNPSQQLLKETVSVSTTNSIEERNFGMLDRFIRKIPNANMITYESIIMNRLIQFEKGGKNWLLRKNDEMGKRI